MRREEGRFKERWEWEDRKGEIKKYKNARERKGYFKDKWKWEEKKGEIKNYKIAGERKGDLKKYENARRGGER